MLRKWCTVLAVCGIVVATSGVAHAAVWESGHTSSSQCSVGSDTRPAVKWQAYGSIDVTPPGYNTTLGYSSASWISRTNGGLMSGGNWLVHVGSGGLDKTYTGDTCTAP